MIPTKIFLSRPWPKFGHIWPCRPVPKFNRMRLDFIESDVTEIWIYLTESVSIEIWPRRPQQKFGRIWPNRPQPKFGWVNYDWKSTESVPSIIFAFPSKILHLLSSLCAFPKISKPFAFSFLFWKLCHQISVLKDHAKSSIWIHQTGVHLHPWLLASFHHLCPRSSVSARCSVNVGKCLVKKNWFRVFILWFRVFFYLGFSSRELNMVILRIEYFNDIYLNTLVKVCHVFCNN